MSNPPMRSSERSRQAPHNLNHLPPKSPSISSAPPAGPFPGCVRVSNFGAAHRRSPSASFVPDVEPSWLEDLLDSPKAVPPCEPRRTSHRRSASDSFTFLDAPSNLSRFDDIAEEDEVLDYASRISMEQQHRDDRLAAMFMEMNPFHQHQQPGQQHRHHQQQQNAGSRIRSMDAWSMDPRALPLRQQQQQLHQQHQHQQQQQQQQQQTVSRLRMSIGCNSEASAPVDHDTIDQGSMDGDTDPKRSKRQSAQRSRVRKLQYIAELEANVGELQNEVTALSTQIAVLEHQRLALHLDNNSLKQSYSAMAQEWLYKEAHTEDLRKEVTRLKQRLSQQMSLSSSTTATGGGGAYNVEGKHLRRASAGSVQDIGSASADVLDSFVRFVEKTDTPATSVLRSSCTLAGSNGKNLETTGRLLPSAPSLPPGFIVHNQ